MDCQHIFLVLFTLCAFHVAVWYQHFYWSRQDFSNQGRRQVNILKIRLNAVPLYIIALISNPYMEHLFSASSSPVTQKYGSRDRPMKQPGITERYLIKTEAGTLSYAIVNSKPDYTCLWNWTNNCLVPLCCQNDTQPLYRDAVDSQLSITCLNWFAAGAQQRRLRWAFVEHDSEVPKFYSAFWKHHTPFLSTNAHNILSMKLL